MTNDFEQLGVQSFFVKRLEERNIVKATDIQKKIIPRLASGENVFFTSATGTGKTFAYLIPFLNKLNETPEKEIQTRGESGIKPRLVIIAPTLELCTQIKNEIDFLLNGTNLKSSLVIGSVSLDRQIEKIRKTRPDIIVGNPNRLLVLANKKIIRLENIKYLVFDEADRLVSDEMIDDTNELYKLIKRYANKKNAGTVITACSATISSKYKEKLLFILDDNEKYKPEIIFVNSDDHEILREKIEHWAIFSEKRRKDQTLRSLLSAIKAKKSKIKVLIFTSRGDEAALILTRLQHHHVSASGLIGKVLKKPISSQERRESLDSFRQGKIEALVSTDLAARGLDIPGITHVIALDVPADSDVYIHRCGRTARAGKRGTMITIGDETQMFLLASMEKKLKIKVIPKELHYGQICAPQPIEE